MLYVALTRAKEKLIMTGTIGKVEKQVLSLARYQDREEVLLPIGMRMKGKKITGPMCFRHLHGIVVWMHSMQNMGFL